MKTNSCIVFASLLAVASVPLHAASKPASDLASPEKRRASVETALRLTRPPEPAPVPADLIQPFNPPGFDQPDPEEVRAAAVAAAARASAPGQAGGGAPGGPEKAPVAPGDREMLESLSVKLPGSGFMTDLKGNPLLVLGTTKLGINDTFTVHNNADGQDYDLTLVAIERTTFTLRYHGEEITRPIVKRK